MYRLMMSVFVSACIASVSCARAYADTAPAPDLSGAHWLILGPFPNVEARGCPGFDNDFLSDIGGEAAARPRRGLATAGHKWEETRAEDGRVNLLRAVMETTDVVAYAYLELESRTDGQAVMKLGSDDGIKVWCNGSLVWVNHVHRGMKRDEDAFKIDLRKGGNRLLLKVDQGGGSWELTARLATLEEERRAWTEAPDVGLRIVLSRRTFERARDVSCTVATQPAFAVDEKVELSVTDVQGRVVGTRSCLTGGQAVPPLPANARGIFFIHAAGAGGKLASATADVPVLVGDVRGITADAVAQARGARPADELAGSTLSFLADQLEGKLPPSLGTPERNVRAIATIAGIRGLLDAGTWRADAMRGLSQWAYRSDIDGSLQPYTLYLPPGYAPGKKHALVVALHGYSGNDYDSASLLASTCPDDFIVVAPYGRGDIGYRTIGEQDVLDVMERVRRLYSVDPDRIYLMGWSMGGMGTWRIGQFYSDRFAAMATFCGWTGTEYLENLRNTPVLIVHGDADESVPYVMDSAAAERLRELGCPATYTQLPGVGHDAWGAWVTDPKNDIFDFFKAHRRDPWPSRVSVTADHLRYGRSFWARVDELSEPPAAGRLEAEVTGERRVRVSAKAIRAFSLDLRHPRLAQSGDLTVTIDGAEIRLKAGQAEAVLVQGDDGVWRAGAAAAQGIARHDGGGIFDLFTGPLTIIYGTVRKDKAEMYKRAALAMSNWAPGRQIGVGSTIGSFRVKPDADVTESDLAGGNLLLIGGAEENRFVAAQWEAMHLTRGKDSVTILGNRVQGTGLLALFPNAHAPRYLAGVIAFPEKARGIESMLTRFLLNAHVYNVNQSVTEATFSPDVIVFKETGALVGHAQAWRGFYDRQWGSVRKVP